MDPSSTPKHPQKHVKNIMLNCFEKSTFLHRSGCTFGDYFYVKVRIFSESFSSIDFEHPFYVFFLFVRTIATLKNPFSCSKTRISANTAFLIIPSKNLDFTAFLASFFNSFSALISCRMFTCIVYGFGGKQGRKQQTVTR